MKLAVRGNDESGKTMAGFLRGIPVRAAFLTTSGIVLHSNDNQEILEKSGGLPALRVGDDFLKACHAVQNKGVPEAKKLVDAFQALVAGTKASQELTYTVGQNGHSRHFRVKLSITQYKGEARILFCQEPITNATLLSEEAELPPVATIGRMTLSIAHDFNNMLTIVRGYADSLEVRIGDDARAVERMSKLRTAIERAAALAQRLLEVGSGTPGEPTELDLNAVVRDLADLLEHICGKRIALTLDLSKSPARILGDRMRIEQILLNLALNARDAMPTGGKLVISTKVSRPRNAARAPQVELSVRDTGAGMSEEVLARIFEPFFTTKGENHGSGLGLHSVAEAVRGLHGEISVQSSLGKGTTFTTCFPALKT